MLTIFGLLALTAAGLAWWSARPGTQPAETGLRASAPAERADAAPETAAQTAAAARPSPRRTVEGVVVQLDGRPVPAADVVLSRIVAGWPDEQFDPVGRVLSGPDGRFRIDVVDDAELVLEASSPGLSTALVAAPPELRTVRIEMEPGFTVQGVAVGPGFVPLADCVVALEPGPWSGRRAVSMRTDADGRFRFDDVRAGETGIARISVRSPPWSTGTIASVPIGSSEPVRIQVVSGVAPPVVGRISASSSGKPIAGATVRVYPSTAWNGRLFLPYTTTTDARGAYELTGLSIGSAIVEVSHPEHSDSTRIVTIGRGSPVQNFELVQRSAVELHLHGDLPEDLEIALRSDAFELSRARVAADGSVHFPDRVSVGPATLEIVGGRCAFARSSGRTLSFAVEDAPRTVLDLELVAPSTLHGRVVDAEGEPIVGATISTPRFRFQPRHPARWFAQTDEQGEFAIRSLPVGSAYLRVEHPDFATLEVDVDTPPPETLRHETIELPRAGSVRGRVTRGGEPVAGATVLAGRDRNATISTVTGADGRYELRLAPGRYRIIARYSSLSIQVSKSVVSVEAAKVADGIDLDFPQGRRLRGVVSSSDGILVPDAFVFVGGERGAMSTTDQNGHFELEVPDGSVDLHVLSPNFRVQVREPVSALAEDVFVRLPSIGLGRLSGSVVCLGDGPPPTEVIVRMHPTGDLGRFDENERRQRVLESVTAPIVAGGFTLERVPDGRSWIEVIAPGYVPFRTEVEVRRRGSADLGELRLEPGAELDGVVRDIDGRPLAGAFVFVGIPADLQHEIARRTMTDAEGRFRVGGISPESSQLVVAAQGYLSRTIELRIPQDLLAEDGLAIELRQGSELSVQLEVDGEPAARVQIVGIEYDGQVVLLSSTDGEGRLSLPIERPGTYRVSIFGRDDEGVEVVFGDEPERRQVRLALR